MKAYHQAVEDGLSDVHAKALARQAADNAKIAATAATESATSGITEVAAMIATPMSLEQLQADFTHYKSLSAKKRAQERVHKRAARKDTIALQTAKEATELEGDVDRVHTELLQTQEKLKHQTWSAEAATDLDTALLSVSAGLDKAEQKQDLIHAITKAMKSLHEMGGKTPAEVQVENLEKELREARGRIQELEAANVRLSDF